MELAAVGPLLRRARERAGLSQEAAAAAVGLNRVVLSYYESGRRQPPLPALVAIARLYGLGVAELLEGAEASPEPAELLFRAAPVQLADQARVGMRQFSGLVSGYVDLVRELDGQLPARQVSPLGIARPKAGRREAARLAREARDYLNVGAGPVGDHLFDIADGIALVFRLPLGHGDGAAPSGLFYNHPRAGFCIVVNSQMSLGRQVFTLAHELAHAFFHSQQTDVWISIPQAPADRERFADLFAGELLVPEDALARAVGDLEPWDDLTDPAVVVHLQRHFGVSYATLLVRLKQQNVISGTQYQALRGVAPSKLAASLGFDVNAADLGDYRMRPLDRFPPRMLRLIRHAVLAGLVTRGDAAETLGISVEEVLQLLDHPTAHNGELRLVEEIEGGARFH